MRSLWWSDDNDEILLAVKKGRLHFSGKEWQPVTPNAKLLIVQMCEKKPSKRPSASSILKKKNNIDTSMSINTNSNLKY